MKRRKLLLISQKKDEERVIKITKELQINVAVTSDLVNALDYVKNYSEKVLLGLIADFNFTIKKNDSVSQELALAIVARANNFFLPSLVFYNQQDKILDNDLSNLKKYDDNKKYPVLKTEKIDWEKAIYLFFFLMGNK